MATPVHFAIEGHFAPFVRLTITTLALAVGGVRRRLERLVLGWVMAAAAYLLDRRLRRSQR